MQVIIKSHHIVYLMQNRIWKVIINEICKIKTVCCSTLHLTLCWKDKVTEANSCVWRVSFLYSFLSYHHSLTVFFCLAKRFHASSPVDSPLVLLLCCEMFPGTQSFLCRLLLTRMAVVLRTRPPSGQRQRKGVWRRIITYRTLTQLFHNS